MSLTTVDSGLISSGAITLTTQVTGTLPVANGGTGVTTAIDYGFKNRIINGAMVIDQRNAGASVTPTSNQYTLDRWQASLSQTGKFSVQQNAAAVTPPVGFAKYLGVTSLSSYAVLAGDLFIIRQHIEGYNTSDLAWGTANAKTVTLSFWVRSSLTGTFGGVLQEGNGATRSYPFSYTISVANTWELKSITIAGDTSGTWQTTNNTSIDVTFGLGVGSTYSGAAGAWGATTYYSATGATSVVGTNGATFYITGVQLEKGSTATSFDYRPYGTELSLCQRYYQYASSMSMPGLIKGTTDTNRSLNIWFSSAMRAAPTMSVTWSSGAQTGSDWVGTNGAHSYKAAGNTTTELAVTAWTATIDL